MQGYKTINHTADIGIELWGRTKKELFRNAVTAMFDLIIERESNGERFKPAAKKTTLKDKTITIYGNDLEDLLINFLREVLYLFNGKNWKVTVCQPIELTSKHIVAQLYGEPHNPKKQHIKMEIKAVTYHGLRIKKIINGWKARVIFDV